MEIKLAKCCATCKHGSFMPRMKEGVCLVDFEIKEHPTHKEYRTKGKVYNVNRVFTCPRWELAPKRRLWMWTKQLEDYYG